MLYERNLKQSMIGKRNYEKEAEVFKKVYNHYIDKRKETMKITSFKVEDVFGTKICKDSISLEQKTKLNIF